MIVKCSDESHAELVVSRDRAPFLVVFNREGVDHSVIDLEVLLKILAANENTRDLLTLALDGKSCLRPL